MDQTERMKKKVMLKRNPDGAADDEAAGAGDTAGVRDIAGVCDAAGSGEETAEGTGAARTGLSRSG